MDSWNIEIQKFTEDSVRNAIGEISSDSALPVRESLHLRNAIRISIAGKPSSEESDDPIRIGIAGKPSSEESHPNRQYGVLRSKSKKINEATRSNESRTLFAVFGKK